MIRLMLADDRTEIDAGAVARAFGISTGELNRHLRAGTITRWFERGKGDRDNTARLVLFATDTRTQVAADETGTVVASLAHRTTPPPDRKTRQAGARRIGIMANEQARENARAESESARRARLDALLDTALQGTFPASDPIAIDVDRPASTRPARSDAE